MQTMTILFSNGALAERTALFRSLLRTSVGVITSEAAGTVRHFRCLTVANCDWQFNKQSCVI